MWSKPDWNRINRYKLDDVKDNSAELIKEEEVLLAEEGKKQVFKNQDLHQSVQRIFLGLLQVAVQEHPDVSRRMEGAF